MHREATSAGAARTAQGIKSKISRPERSERRARIGDEAASPLGPVDPGVEPGPDHRGFELGGRAEGAGQCTAGSLGIALDRKHVGAEPRRNPRTPHAPFYSRTGK